MSAVERDALFEAALEHALRGWAVFPVNLDKEPFAGTRGFKDATTDHAKIAQWWTQHPTAGIGSPVPEGFFVLDIDPRHGGEESLEKLIEENGPLPPTVTTRTGSGGRHLRFRMPRGYHGSQLRGSIGPGLDVKAGGKGYVVLPPSPHRSGQTYSFEPYCDPETQQVADSPSWLLTLVLANRRGAGDGESAGLNPAEILKGVQEGERDTTLFRYACDLRRRWIPRAEAETLVLAAARACRPPLPDRECLQKVDQAWKFPAGDGTTREAERSSNAAAPWPKLHESALYGLAGDVVRTIGPHTEADQVGVLVHFLAMFGNAVGPTPHVQVEATAHGANIFAVLVGRTSRGRKGTSEGQARRILEAADPRWAKEQIVHGLSSGEGLIEEVRDRTKKEEEEGLGPRDRRLLVIETEFAGTLRNMRRDGNILSSVIRQAWDTGNLRTMTRRAPLRATDAHVSIVGHATGTELLNYMEDQTENGFANRFLWLCVRRSKLLPDGGSLTDADLAPLFARTEQAVAAGRITCEVKRSPEARKLWHQVYPQLTTEYPGIFGAVTSRAEAQVTRLSLLYALLDESKEIRLQHINAALALWGYASASARHIFGDLLGDPIADRILKELRRQRSEGLTRTDITSGLFGRNMPAALLERALLTLQSLELAFEVLGAATPNGGRPAERWFAR